MVLNVIVCGGGQVGSTIAEYLSHEEANVTLVDIDPAIIKKINETQDIRAVQGHACLPDVLWRADARNADMVIAVTSDDEVNIVSCQVAHSLFDVKTKIARLRNRSYLNEQYSDLFTENHIPIDVLISPEQEVADAIIMRLKVPGASDVVSLARGKVFLLGIYCYEDCPLVNTALGQLDELFPELQMKTIGIMRDEKIIWPTEDAQFLEGDNVYTLVAREHIDRVMEAFGHYEKRARRLIIAGGGNIGLSLAQAVEDVPDVKAKIVETNLDRAKEISQQLKDTVVLHGDMLDQDLLDEISFDTAETFVAVTNDDEFNMMASLLAKKHHCPRVITLLNTATYIPLVSQLGIDVTINPRALTISGILQHVRRGRVRSIYSISEDFGEIMEMDVTKNTPVVNQRVSDLDLPKNVIVGAIVRGNEVILPEADETIMEFDRVVTFTPHSSIKALEKRFRTNRRAALSI